MTEITTPAAPSGTVGAVVGRAIPDEYAGRAMEESMRKDIVFGLSGGNLKRLRYSESLFPEWSAEKRKQLRLELVGEDYPANTPVRRSETAPGETP